MGTVRLTSEVENDRLVRDNRAVWDYFSSYSLVEAVRKAKEMGWRNKKVQVRVEYGLDKDIQYHVEPFERDCPCPNLLKYSDFFD